MRIGLFGGTFNPIHLGHLRAAVEVEDGFGLDKLILIPSALPPHKTSGIAVALIELFVLSPDLPVKLSPVTLMV